MSPTIVRRLDWEWVSTTIILEGYLDFILSYVGAATFAVPNANAAMDVVFVHGLGGDRVGTWRFSPAACWPTWVAEDFSNANVFCAGYKASPLGSILGGLGASLGDIATMLADGLVSAKTKSPCLVLIGHSLGGLVIKQMLRTLADFPPNRNPRPFWRG